MSRTELALDDETKQTIDAHVTDIHHAYVTGNSGGMSRVLSEQMELFSRLTPEGTAYASQRMANVLTQAERQFVRDIVQRVFDRADAMNDQ
jgi:hypothetical protein